MTEKNLSSGLKIIFGLNLDGSVYPIKNKFSECVCGQFKLIKILEQRCGIKIKNVSQSERIEEYRKVLDSLKKGRFYEEAFNFDDWSVAKELLSWRDALVLGGWDTEVEFTNDRLKVISDVEQQLSSGLKYSIGDRLLEIRKKIPSVLLRIDRIELVDQMELLPKCWADLFKEMEDQKVVIESLKISDRKAKIHCLKADTEYLVADVFAEWFKAGENNKDVVLIADQSTNALNHSFKSRNMPSLGVSTDAENAPSYQVFLALIDLMDGPFDSQKMYEFLKMPGNPLILEDEEMTVQNSSSSQGEDSSDVEEVGEEEKSEKKIYFHSELCHVLERFPGNENKEWKDVVARLAKKYEGYEVFLELANEKYEVDNKKLKKALTLFKNNSRNNELKRKVDLFLKIADLDNNNVSIVRLKRLAQTILLEPVVACSNDEEAEVTDFAVVASPGNILSESEDKYTFKYGIWWGFKDCKLSQGVNPWTNAEMDELQKNYIEPDSAEHIAQRTTNEWYRAYSNVENLIIPLLKRNNGDEAEIHPFADEIINDQANVVEVDFSQSSIELADRKILFKQYQEDDKEIMSISINKNTELREKTDKNGSKKGGESATSLDNIFKCPLKYYFQYNLNLYKPEYGAASEYTTLGNVVHRVIQKMICPKDDGNVDNAWLSDTDENLETKIKQCFEQILKEQAAYLNNKIRLGLKVKLLHDTIENVKHLRDFIKEYNLEIVGSEFKVFEGLEKIVYTNSSGDSIEYDMSDEGRIDLLLKYKDTKNYFVLDFKNTNKSTYDALIKDGKSVQLSFYSVGVEKKFSNSTVKNVGYFKLKGDEIKIHSPEKGFKTAKGFKQTPLNLEEAWKNVNDQIITNLKALKKNQLVIDEMDKNQSEDCCNYCDFKNICNFYVKCGEKHDKK